MVIRLRVRNLNKKPKWKAVLESFKKVTAVLLIAGLNWHGLQAVGETAAYFIDSESSGENLFIAATLEAEAKIVTDFAPLLGEATQALANSMVTNTGTLDFYYKITTLPTEGELCPLVDLTATAINGANTYSHTQLLPEFSFEPGPYSLVGGAWNLSAALTADAQDWQGKSCDFRLIFTGSQNGDGSGFSDAEILQFTIVADGPGDLVWTTDGDFNGVNTFINVEVFVDSQNGGDGDVKIVGSTNTNNFILRPDADGAASTLQINPASPTTHWDKVDESTSDNDSTYVYVGKDQGQAAYQDLYNLPNPALGGTINYVKIHSWCEKTGGDGAITNTLKTHGAMYSSSSFQIGTVWSEFPPAGDNSATFANNPSTGQPWTWSEVNDLQAGVILKKNDNSNHYLQCSQVWVTVNCTQTTYPTQGIIVSDAGAGAGSTSAWQELAWVGDVLPQTAIKFSVAATNKDDCTGITDWQIANQQDNTIDLTGLPESKYICWKAVLDSSAPYFNTPVLREVKISYISGSALELKINEFLPVPSGGNEWIELYNLSDRAIDLNDWQIQTMAGMAVISGINAVPADGVIPVQGFMLVNLAAGSLGDTADDVILRDTAGKMIGSHSYNLCNSEPVTPSPGMSNGDGTDVPDPSLCGVIPTDKSYAVIPDGNGEWYDPIPTPGAPNVLELTDEFAVQMDATTTPDIARETDQYFATTTEPVVKSEMFLEPAEGLVEPEIVGEVNTIDEAEIAPSALAEGENGVVVPDDGEPSEADQSDTSFAEALIMLPAADIGAEPKPEITFEKMESVLFAGVDTGEDEGGASDENVPVTDEPAIVPAGTGGPGQEPDPEPVKTE